jgi:hypothetical protein
MANPALQARRRTRLGCPGTGALADRWGRVERDGSVVVPLPLTHRLLAGIVGSQRPTVTTALSRLAERRRVSRRDDGWVLHGAPPTSGLLEGQALADAFRLRDD